MNTQEIMEAIYQQAGEPSDLCPYTDPGDYATFDFTRSESVRLLRIANMSLKRIGAWRFRNNVPVKHRNLLSRIYWNWPGPITGTALSGSSNSIEIQNLASNLADQFNGWIIEITNGTGFGQSRFVVDTIIGPTSTQVLVNSSWDTIPDATSEYRLYRSFAKINARRVYTVDDYDLAINPVTELQDILKVRDVTSGSDLTPTLRENVFTETSAVIGIPSEYRVYGDFLMFDTALVDPRSFEILYLRQPVALTAQDQVPDISEVYHEAIVLWGVHYIQRMNQAFGPAYATKREVEDFMEMTRIHGYSESDLDIHGVTVYG